MQDNRAEAIKALVAQWIGRARSDLILAQMTEDERFLPEILTFHAQQAAEKALEALLVHDQAVTVLQWVEERLEGSSAPGASKPQTEDGVSEGESPSENS